MQHGTEKLNFFITYLISHVVPDFAIEVPTSFLIFTIFFSFTRPFAVYCCSMTAYDLASISYVMLYLMTPSSIYPSQAFDNLDRYSPDFPGLVPFELFRRAHGGDVAGYLRLDQPSPF